MKKRNHIRYEFGKNWKNFSKTVNENSIRASMESIIKLLGNVKGKTILDIGCGSGIHAIAFIRLGVKSITCFDYDLDSVNTTRDVVKYFCKDFKNFDVFQGDILNITSTKKYDIVYSWGVLHHTGNMDKAINKSINFVNKNGLFAVALYLKTKMCKFWKKEKKIYSKHKILRPLIKIPFFLLILIGYSLKQKKSPFFILKKYFHNRGMSLYHDIDDWLGGYPYESIETQRLEKLLSNKNFVLTKKINISPKIGIFGSGCGEWVFKMK